MYIQKPHFKQCGFLLPRNDCTVFPSGPKSHALKRRVPNTPADVRSRGSHAAARPLSRQKTIDIFSTVMVCGTPLILRETAHVFPASLPIKKGTKYFAPFGSRTPGPDRYRCFLSNLAGLAAVPPPDSRSRGVYPLALYMSTTGISCRVPSRKPFSFASPRCDNTDFEEYRYRGHPGPSEKETGKESLC